MSSIAKENCLTFKAGTDIPRGHLVKMGANKETVVVCTAATDLIIGVAMTGNGIPGDAGEGVLAGDHVEVALVGGGCRPKAGGTIAAGSLLTSDGTGRAIATTTPGNRYIATAMEDAVVGDLFSAHAAAGLI